MAFAAWMGFILGLLAWSENAKLKKRVADLEAALARPDPSAVAAETPAQ